MRKYVENGHARVKLKYVDEDGFKLGNWVSTHRRAFKAGTLSSDRAKLLESFPGWEWDLREKFFEEGVKQLKKYVDKNGHSLVHGKYVDEDGFKLGVWVSSRRKEYNKGKLPVDRIKFLESIPGWIWDLRTK